MEDYLDVYYKFYRDKHKNIFMYLDTLIIRGIDNRYKGLGTKTLNELIKLSKDNGCKYIELHADTKQPQAEGFVLVEWYEKFGFKSIGKKGWTEIMVKNLISQEEDILNEI